MMDALQWRYNAAELRPLGCLRVNRQLRDDGMAADRSGHRAHRGARGTDAAGRPGAASRCRLAAHADHRHQRPGPGPGYRCRGTIGRGERCPPLDRNGPRERLARRRRQPGEHALHREARLLERRPAGSDLRWRRPSCPAKLPPAGRMNAGSLGPRRLGAAGIEVSALSLGSWRTYERLPAETGIAILRAAREEGINFFDDGRYDDQTGTAPIRTGYSEVVVGELFRGAGVRRDEAVVTNKLWWEFWPEQGAEAELDASLQRMAFDYVDVIYANPAPRGMAIADLVVGAGGPISPRGTP